MVSGDAAARARIGLCYRWRHGRWPDLDNAPRFTEMVQRRKLFDRDPPQTALMDKLAAKVAVGVMLGTEWCVPTLWAGARLPPASPFAFPAILKARHGRNQYRVLESVPQRDEWSALRRLGSRWVDQPYGLWLDEWAYRDTPRGLLAEALLGQRTLPVDYKVYVFGGRATHVQVHLDRATRHRWILHDRDWRQIVPAHDAPPPPRSLSAMLAAAETLAAGHDFLRVDFYEVAGRPLFGEFCLYPGSGLDPFAADWIDFELGTLWHAAAADLCTAQVKLDFSPVSDHLATIEARLPA